MSRTPSDHARGTKEGNAPGRTDQGVRLSVNLSPGIAGELKEYAERKGISITEAIRRAITVLSFVDDAQQRGAAINLEENGALKEVLFLV